MSFPYEGPQNELRLRVRPSTHQIEQMAPLPMKSNPTVRKNRTTPKATWEQRKAAADQKVKRVQASTQRKTKQPALQGRAGYKESQHPRDRFGRFAVKALKATGKAIKGTVKAAHKTVKRVNTIARRNDALRHRERKLDLHKREVAAGLKKPRTVRRKAAPAPKKQGILGRLFGGSPKKQVRRKR